MTEDSPKVALMVLNYNGLEWLKICLPSISRSTYEKLETYVIDNGSTDGSVEYVESEFPGVNVIAFEKNLGFAKAYNDAVSRINADYIVLLNNDTRVLTPAWIDLLVEEAETSTKLAAIGCKIVSMQHKGMLDSLGGCGMRYWRGFMDIGRDEEDLGQYDAPPITPFSFCGAAVLIRTDLFKFIGGFDTSFFSYLEDVDLSWRLRLLGYEIGYEPTAKVEHHFSGTARRGNERWKRYLIHRNLLRMYLKDCGCSLRWALRNYFLLYSTTILAELVFHPLEVLPILRGILWNLTNLRSTLAARAIVQNQRTVSDASIIQPMYPEFGKKLGFPKGIPSKLLFRILLGDYTERIA